MTTTHGKKPKFPLPRGYFGDVQFSKEQTEFYREFCASQVQRGLLDEKAFALKGKKVNAKKWKPVRSQHNFKLFRRRDGGLYENDGKPSMLGVGRVEGSIEDVIYGAYDQTDEELRMTAELVEVDFGDGIVLNNIEQGSDNDLYRYLGIKWILTPFPMPALMPDRDWVLLESAGISTDATGRRYGYHTLFTVDLPQCPEFPEVIRGAMWYTFIYRDAGKGTIDVYSQGYFDCRGELMDPLTIIGSTQMFNGVFRYMKSSEAKKLTIMALENLERKIAAGQPAAVDDKAAITAAGAACSICTKHRSSMPFSSRRMRVCRVCDAVVCMNCRIKKNILVGRQRVQSKVSVCQKCIAHAKSLIVQPANEKYVISREMQLGGVDRGHAASTVSTAFQTMASSQHQFGTLLSRDPTWPRYAEERGLPSSTYGGDQWGSGYNDDVVDEQPQRPIRGRPARSASREGVTLTESYYHARSTSVAPPVVGSPPVEMPRSQSLGAAVDTGASAVEQQALFTKMMQLQESAKRAHELTEASRVVMMENNVGA